MCVKDAGFPRFNCDVLKSRRQSAGLILPGGNKGDCLHAPLSLPWCPWNATEELKHFLLGYPLPRKNCLGALALSKAKHTGLEEQRWQINLRPILVGQSTTSIGKSESLLDTLEGGTKARATDLWPSCHCRPVKAQTKFRAQVQIQGLSKKAPGQCIFWALNKGGVMSKEKKNEQTIKQTPPPKKNGQTHSFPNLLIPLLQKKPIFETPVFDLHSDSS